MIKIEILYISYQVLELEVASTEQPEESISDNRNVKSSVNLQQEENINKS